MVDWVAVWQAAKKGLSHSPYVTCFPSASAVRIRYQHAPAEGLSVLNCGHLAMPPFLCFLPVSLIFFFYPLPVLLVSHVTWIITDKRTLMHVESMAAQHTYTSDTHKQNSHLLICQQHCSAFKRPCTRVCLCFF